MPNYTTKLQYIKETRSRYLKYSLTSVDKQSKFINNLKIFNNKSGEYLNLKYDFLQNCRDDYLWLIFQSVYMQNNLSDDYTAVFITLTLPSEYHPYKTLGNKKEVVNNNYDSSLCDGAEKLNDSFRYIYNNFRINRKKIPLQYQRVIEPHKSFVPHLHALVYVPSVHVEQFTSHVENQIFSCGLGSQKDITIIKDIKKSASYLLKYIKKNLSGDDLVSSHVINGWKKTNRIRIYTHSKSSIPKYIFQKLSRVIKPSYEIGENILSIIENLCDISIQYKEYNDTLCHNEFRLKEIVGDSVKYKVHVDIAIKKKKVITDIDLLNDFQESVMNNDFYMIMEKDYFNAYDFYSYIEQMELHTYDFLNPFDSKEIFETYFYSISNADLFGYWENYLLEDYEGYEKHYKVEEFEVIEIETNEVLYKKSDWSLV